MFRIPVTVILLLVLGRDTATADEPPSRPNIVLFFVDDFGQRDLGCYGSTFYETPYMDQLAADGVRFTNAYAAYPRCVPSRQGLLSGKYPCRIDATSRKAKGNKHALPLSEVTFAEALREHDYATCYIGKWHLGHTGDDVESAGGPGEQGFDTVIHSGSAGATSSYFFPFPPEKKHHIENPVGGQDGDYLTDRLTDAAVEYIDAHKDQPFLLTLAHYAVHTPLEAPEDLERKYKKKLRKAGLDVGGKRTDPDMVTDRSGVTKTVQNNPTYAAMVEKTDDSLGRVLDALETAGVADNTVVILTSDHGGLSTRGLENKRALATSNSPLRQGKGSIFEGGTRVPLIVRWPGHVTPGAISDVRVTGTDHYPTMLALAGVPLRPEQHVDGHSYVPALQGESYERVPIFCYKYTARPDSTGDTRAMSLLDGQYKIIDWIDEDLVELFDLTADEGEQTNLAESMPERTALMLKTLRATEASIGNLRQEGKRQMQKRAERKAK